MVEIIHSGEIVVSAAVQGSLIHIEGGISRSAGAPVELAASLQIHVLLAQTRSWLGVLVHVFAVANHLHPYSNVFVCTVVSTGVLAPLQQKRQ